MHISEIYARLSQMQGNEGLVIIHFQGWKLNFQKVCHRVEPHSAISLYRY